MKLRRCMISYKTTNGFFALQRPFKTNCANKREMNGMNKNGQEIEKQVAKKRFGPTNFILFFVSKHK